MKRHRYKYKGWLSAEMIAAVAVLAILIGVLGTLGSAFKRTSDLRWLRQQMTAAGQAQMDAIAVTGEPIDEATFARLWPKVTCRIAQSTGTGQWAGLTEVTLTLSAEKRGKTVQTTLTRYISAERSRR